MNTVNKVTAFILREVGKEKQILMFRHPNAGIQIPAGTVEDGETPEIAVLREVVEETGLDKVRIDRHLGVVENELVPGEAVIFTSTVVYARPDTSSFDWAYLRKGIGVRLQRSSGDWSQVEYIEWDRYPDPQYVSMQITGWVPSSCLAMIKKRHFFQLSLMGEAGEQWDRAADYHTYSLFWAPLSSPPPIVDPQNRWLDIIYNHMDE
jgi:8-oxo-dGTP pyrophosphatase MutT (NUDIX family)